jgi:hypothetical protein
MKPARILQTRQGERATAPTRSLKHPFARVFPALRHFAAGDLKVTQCGVFPIGNPREATIWL